MELRIVYVLSTYCLRIVYVLSTYCLRIVYVLSTYCSSCFFCAQFMESQGAFVNGDIRALRSIGARSKRSESRLRAFGSTREWLCLYAA